MLPAVWRYKRFHVSYLIAWLCVGLLLGLLVGSGMQMGAWWLVGTVAAALVFTSFKSRRWYACLIIVIVGLLLGCIRGSLFAGELRGLSGLVGTQVTVVGKLAQDPVLMNGSDVWKVEIEHIRVHSTLQAGSIYATVVSDEMLRRSDEVTVSGKLLTGFGTFQASMYRASVKHISRPNDPFLAIRDSFAGAVRRVMPEPEASLGLGFVIGQKSALPDDLVEQLKIVGLTHIVVASGYNLTILVRFARRVLARRSRYLAFAGSVVLILGFIFVSGFSASMNRAAVVTILSLLAWYYGRKFHPIQLILLVAATSALVNPLYVWGDLGWLLSFVAFTGVLVVAPIMTRLFYAADKKPGATVQLVIETLSAEIMTLPVLIVSFGYIPVFALLANVLVAPVIPMAMLLTFIAGLVGWVAPGLAILALPATILIAYVIAIVERLAGVEWAQLAVTVSLWFGIVWYAVLFIVGLSIWRRRKVDLLARSVVE